MHQTLGANATGRAAAGSTEQAGDGVQIKQAAYAHETSTGWTDVERPGAGERRASGSILVGRPLKRPDGTQNSTATRLILHIPADGVLYSRRKNTGVVCSHGPKCERAGVDVENEVF